MTMTEHHESRRDVLKAAAVGTAGLAIPISLAG